MTNTGHDARTAAIVENINRRKARDVVRVETNEIERLPDEWTKRLERLERLWNRFENSQEARVPLVLEEILDRIQKLEDKPIDITPAEPAEFKADIDALVESINEVGAAALGHINVLATRLNALESRMNSFPEQLLREVAQAKQEIKSRTA